MDDSNIADFEPEEADWKDTLIRVYLFVCRRWAAQLHALAQRQSNNSDPEFTDEEVLTIYLFGLIRKRLATQRHPRIRRGSLFGVVS